MGKYGGVHKVEKPRVQETHPVWRGIGCILMFLVPILSYGLAMVTVEIGESARWRIIPPELLGPPRLPQQIWQIPQLVPFAQLISKWNNGYAYLLFAFIYLIVLASLISVGYSLAYRVMGPPRYGPQDVPPPKHKPKPYKR